MRIECNQIMFNVSDLQEAKEFYVGLLGCELIEEHPRMFAFRAGDVRFSVFVGGRQKRPEGDEDVTHTMMFRVANLEDAVRELEAKGLRFLGEIQEAPGFMKHASLLDPDNNELYLAEYSRDPLKPATK